MRYELPAFLVQPKKSPADALNVAHVHDTNLFDQDDRISRKMTQVWVYVAAVSVTVILSLGNIGLKAISGSISAALAGIMVFDFTPLIASIPRLFGVGCIYVVGAGLWLWVLNHLPLNRAFMFVSLTFIFIPLFSYLILGERIGLGVIIGTPVIIAGLIIAAVIG